MDATASPAGLGPLTSRPCPVCGSVDDARVFASQRLDIEALDAYAFASRKRPEFMRLRLVECPVCDLVYASPVPAPEALADAYEAAAFDSAIEAAYAARTYAAALAPVLEGLPSRRSAMDIGTGEGAFLNELLRLGFADVRGVEPSTEPVLAAPAHLRPLIEHGIFRRGIRPAASVTLITCFMTIEHVADPAEMVRDAFEVLEPGGALAIVCHDRRARLNRVLGLRSPIVDLEHQQLFSPQSIDELLRRGGLVRTAHHPIRNRYPARYWARLLPVPAGVGTRLDAALEKTGVGPRPVSLSVGNLVAWGFKPEA